MKRYRMLAWLLMAVLVIFLTGCIDITQEMTVNPDGSGHLKIDMGMSEMLFQGSGTTTSNPVSDLEKTANNDPLIKPGTVKTNEYSKDQMKHFVVEYDVINFTDYITKQATASTSDNLFGIKLDKLANGNTSFSMNLSAGSDVTSQTQGVDAAQLKSMFEGRFYIVSLTVPSVVKVEKSDYATQNGNNITWKIPMGDVFSNSASGKAMTLQAEYGMTPGAGGGSSILLIVIIAVVVIAIIAVVVLFVLRRKPAAAAATAAPNYSNMPQYYPPQQPQQPQYPPAGTVPPQQFPPQQYPPAPGGYPPPPQQQPPQYPPAAGGYPPAGGTSPAGQPPQYPGYPQQPPRPPQYPPAGGYPPSGGNPPQPPQK